MADHAPVKEDGPRWKTEDGTIIATYPNGVEKAYSPAAVVDVLNGQASQPDESELRLAAEAIVRAFDRFGNAADFTELTAALAATLESTPAPVEPVFIARCPEHGLHGERTECFVCGGPVEQVPMFPAPVEGAGGDEPCGTCGGEGERWFKPEFEFRKKVPCPDCTTKDKEKGRSDERPGVPVADDEGESSRGDKKRHYPIGVTLDEAKALWSVWRKMDHAIANAEHAATRATADSEANNDAGAEGDSNPETPSQVISEGAEGGDGKPLVMGPGSGGELRRVQQQLAESGLDVWSDRAKEVRNDAQDFWPPWFEVAEADEWIVTFALPVYTKTRDKIKRAIAGFETKDGAGGLASELNTFVQCAIDEALLAATQSPSPTDDTAEGEDR